MRKRTKTLALILIPATALALLAFVLRPKAEPEPQYKGRPLSYWTIRLPEHPEDAKEAIDAIGADATKAISYQSP
jgi:hypothetical protein